MSIEIVDLEIPGAKLIRHARHVDDRGTFVETFDAAVFRDRGVPHEWVQDSTSISARAGTIRGLHFQIPPNQQAKLVRVASGRIFDVLVDLRIGSPTETRVVTLELDADDWVSLLVPAGLAHGFCTLTPDVGVAYKMSCSFAPESYAGIRFDDPELGVDWPVSSEDAIVSARDRSHPLLRDFRSPFSFGGT